MAKYYLGKCVNGKYFPVNENLCNTDIMSVVNFTTRFEDKKALKAYLFACGYIDGSEPLAYIIQKGDSYNKIANGSYLAYSSASAYNTYNGLLQTLINEKFNLELYTFLGNKLSGTYQNAVANVPQLIFFKPVLNEVNYAASLGMANYKACPDKRDLNKLIEDFVLASVGYYDKSTGKYKLEDGSIKVDKRKLTDLMLLLNEYYDIKIREFLATYTQPSKVQEEIEDDDEQEEFLTEDDFLQHGYDPDDFTKLIRKP